MPEKLPDDNRVTPGGSDPLVSVADLVPLPPMIGSDGSVSRTTPSRSVVDRKSSGPVTKIDSVRDAVCLSAPIAASVAVTVNECELPSWDGGVPLRTPAPWGLAD